MGESFDDFGEDSLLAQYDIGSLECSYDSGRSSLRIKITWVESDSSQTR